MIFLPPRHKDAKDSRSFFILHPSSLILFFIFAFRLSPSAFAGNGQTDILPDGATTFTISAPGSYVLVANVTMTVPNVDCITVAADGVSIDLNGHMIIGNGSGTGDGIHGTGWWRVFIFNGNIVNCGGDGIEVGESANVHDVTSSYNGRCGILTGQHSTVERCNCTYNNEQGSLAGISVGDNSIVRNCVANQNSALTSGAYSYGIFTLASCTVTGNISQGNVGNGAGGGNGIYTGNSCTISGNTCSGNTSSGTGYGEGISSGSFSTLNGNTCSGNTGGATSGPGIGISASNNSTVSGNTCYGNSGVGTDLGYGIIAGASCLVSQNTCNANNSGVTGGVGYGIYVTNGYSQIVGNTCDYNRGHGSGDGCGIRAGAYSLIRENSCTDNDASGTGTGYGVRVTSDTRVIGNNCATNGGTLGYGIYVDSLRNVISNNSTSQNTTSGIYFAVAGQNRAELNRMAEGAITGGAPSSVGTGEFANIAY